jgi:hypothetical protein
MINNCIAKQQHKKYYLLSFLVCLLFACQQKKILITEAVTITIAENARKTNTDTSFKANLNFWKNRSTTKSFDAVALAKYAQALLQQFKATANIADLLVADSLYKNLDTHFNQKDATYKLNLVNTALLQHQFNNADSFLQQAKNLGVDAYVNAVNTFDVCFETGNFLLANTVLNKIKNYNNYNFLFRNAKWHHYSGNIDSAIVNLQKAVIIAHDNKPLKLAALANLADFYLHNNNPKMATTTYLQCLQIAPNHAHSIVGIATIALLHDNNATTADLLTNVAIENNNDPTLVFKQAEIALHKGDNATAVFKAQQFCTIASNKMYGNMYNKFLIATYTGILNNNLQALNIANTEVASRATPQTYAWQVWCLAKNNKLDAAAQIYAKQVSGMPLEGLELYYMGKYMQLINKTYNAVQFYNAAYKNKYDLPIWAITDIQKTLH